jgi:hypothetical protein
VNPIDANGNILYEKDFVAVHVGNNVLTGVVERIKESSLVMAKGNEMLPGFITIQIPVNFMYNHQMPKLAQIYKLVKPPGFGDKPQA